MHTDPQIKNTQKPDRYLLQTVTSQAGGPDIESVKYLRWEITLNTGGDSGAGGKTSIVSIGQWKSW